ncbi:MAG: hypothetical protein HY716_07595 [Planctomycetes bacterium]|nr:hypothetical protein [Planctomycetota bacterium]
MTRIFALACAIALPCLAQDGPARSPEEEYARRLAEIKKRLAEEHYKVGEFLHTVQMYAWARDEYNKALALDPDHEGARRRLGYTRDEAGAWRFDPTAKLETQNRKKGDDAARTKLQYEDRYQKLGRNIAKKWYDLGNYCKSNKMEEEALAAWKKAVEYDPEHAASRRKLGHVREGKDGPWLTPFEAKIRKEMKEGVKSAPEGEPDDEQTEVEKDLGLKHEKRRSEHFLIEAAGLNQNALKREIQFGEHAYAMFHKLFAQEADLFSQPYNFVVLKDKATHVKYVDFYHQGPPAKKDLARKSTGMGGFPRSEWTLGDSQQIHDQMVHMTVQSLSRHLAGGERHWLHEGLAYHFTKIVLGTAGTLCVDLTGTSAGSDGKNYQDPEHWPLVIRTWVKEGKDPNIYEVFNCTNLGELSGAETVKAWSMVDFLITEHREKFIEFMTKLRGQREDEDAKILKEVFGWTLEDFDARWQAYARTAY